MPHPSIATLESELQRLFECNLAGMGQASLEGRFLRCNPALARILGAPNPAAIIGEPTLRFYADPTRRAALVEQVIREGLISNLEIELCRLNGELRWVLANVQLVRLETGEAVVEGTLIDITDHKLAERAVREKAEHLRLMLEQMPGVVWTTDAQLRVTSISGATLEAVNQPPEALLGLPLVNVTQHASDPDLIRDMHQRALRGERLSYETRFATHSYQCHLEPLRDPDDQIVGTVGVALDDTAGVQAREELARSNSELQNFAYAASHDLQEPLRTVSSFTQLLAKRLQPRLSSEDQELMGFVLDGTERMQRLLHDLLGYSRVSTHRRDPIPVDCNQVLDRVRCNLHRALEESGTRLDVAPLPVVVADPSQLDQLFQNLISNAIKFRTSLSPAVQVTVEPAGRQWRFAVQDNGIGLDPQYAERIFRIFQRLHTRVQYPGTGIGLAICQRIVEQHGGRIWVESEAGHGATFYFTLPAAPPGAVPEVVPAQDQALDQAPA